MASDEGVFAGVRDDIARYRQGGRHRAAPGPGRCAGAHGIRHRDGGRRGRPPTRPGLGAEIPPPSPALPPALPARLERLGTGRPAGRHQPRPRARASAVETPLNYSRLEPETVSSRA